MEITNKLLIEYPALYNAALKEFSEYFYDNVTVRMFQDLTYGKIIVFSIVASLYMPALGLLLGGLSKNKIEGFAYMKSSGFLIFIPLLLLFDAFLIISSYPLNLNTTATFL